MDLTRRLASDFASAHPNQAAAVLDDRPAPEVARVLGALPDDSAAQLLLKMSPGPTTQALELLESKSAAQILSHMPTEAIAAALRAIDAERREAILSELEPRLEQDLRRIIDSPPGTAGALMDPRAVALPLDLTVAEALVTLRREAEHVLYNVYAVDRDRVLAGVFNLQALFAAAPEVAVSTIVQPAHHRLLVTADRRSILEHEGWQSVYSLPVVDEQGLYVGAIRYRTLRRLELESRDAGGEGVTAAALGDLFRTGIGGVIEALSGMVDAPRPASERRSKPTAERGVEP